MTETLDLMAALKASLAEREESWLREREGLIGASEWAAILGVHPTLSAFSVWTNKVGRIKLEETPSMRWGKRAEALVADIYCEASGRPVFKPAAMIVHHPDVPWLGASLDRVTAGSKANPAPADGQNAPLECKVVGVHKAQDWKDEPPLEYVIQVQAQMACTGAQWASLAALTGWPPEPAWVDIQRNDRFISLALPRLEEFWMRVQKREPPEVDAKTGTSDAIRAFWAADNGQRIHLPAHAMDLVLRWEAAKARRLSVNTNEEEELQNKLRVLMKDAAIGMLPDGSSLTLKTTPATTIAAHERKASRTLRRFWPKGLRRK